MQGFAHDSVFPIQGKHLGMSCASCHTGQEFNESAAICASCHREPEIHADYFGLRCQMCHTDEGWQPARLMNHDFPLEHGNKENLSCTACHTGAYFSYTCTSCHEHEEKKMQTLHEATGIEPEKIPDCSSCHLDGLVHKEP